MDPITAALTLATKLAEIHLATLQAMPEPERAAYAKIIGRDRVIADGPWPDPETA